MIVGQRVQPGRERSLSAEGVQAVKGFQQNVLGQIKGLVGVPAQGQTLVVNFLKVALVEHFHTLGVAPPVLFNPVFILGWRRSRTYK
jgi:hypothetical protein